MTDIVEVPALVEPAPFPTTADRSAGVYNSKAKTWADTESLFGESLHAIGTATHQNAVAAKEAADAASPVFGYRNDAISARDRAETAADSAESSAISASKLNLGNKSIPPTIDNQGHPILSGATYYDTTLGKWRVWNGSAWADGISAVAGVSSFNGLTGNVIYQVAEVVTATNISPTNGESQIKETPALTGSTYYEMYGAAQSAIQVQVHTSTEFSAPAYSSGDQPAGTSFTLTAGVLQVNTTYYWRVRYKSARGAYSDWSAPTSFTTAAQFNSYIPTPAATPANFGDALEGGFYTGMIWSELVQSATSTTIGTGSKTFTVPSMTGAPIVYAGQQLEVRSRANPVNKMVGTVTGAAGTALTLNITSVGGSGTFTDWSIMSRYRVIVAPKASGENTSIAYKNANTAAPVATGTLTEGRKATLAMVGADTSAVYPAAHWCNNLNIGGKTDWYLPARDELELCWRNLKPVADANYTSADRPSGATPDYQNLGSYGGTEATHGLNKNSAPTGVAYTSGAPAQTAATAFRTGGAEAFAYGSERYWSSTEYDASFAWLQLWLSSGPGYQNSGSKTDTYRVRAVRRSII